MAGAAVIGAVLGLAVVVLFVVRMLCVMKMFVNVIRQCFIVMFTLHQVALLLNVYSQSSRPTVERG